MPRVVLRANERSTMKRGSIYPSWRYHATEPPVLCQSADQDDALGADWSDEDIRQAGVEEKARLAEAGSEPVAAATPQPKKTGRKKA